MLTRGGYLLHAWGDRNYRFQTASTGKAFCWALVGFAVEDRPAGPDEPINRSWTGEGQLSHPHKYLDRGHHESLTGSTSSARRRRPSTTAASPSSSASAG